MSLQQIEREISQVSQLLLGYRSDGYDVKVNKQEQERLTKWLTSLQTRRRALLTPAQIASEDSIPF
jgi:hypothetical protein